MMFFWMAGVPPTISFSLAQPETNSQNRLKTRAQSAVSLLTSAFLGRASYSRGLGAVN
jgi:hypothetical protein